MVRIAPHSRQRRRRKNWRTSNPIHIFVIRSRKKKTVGNFCYCIWLLFLLLLLILVVLLVVLGDADNGDWKRRGGINGNTNNNNNNSRRSSIFDHTSSLTVNQNHPALRVRSRDYEEKEEEGTTEPSLLLDDDAIRQRIRLQEEMHANLLCDDDHLHFHVGDGDNNAWRLFCRVALQDPNKEMDDDDENILIMYQRAIGQISDVHDLRTYLQMAKRTNEKFLGKYNVELWTSTKDKGLQHVLEHFNSRKNHDEYGLLDWKDRLGPGTVFVDVGSNLGIITLAVLLEYPGTKVVSMEPAAPNWLYQLLNLGRNVPDIFFDKNKKKSNVTLLPYGLGQDDNVTQTLLWRMYTTTATRDWIPIDEKRFDSIVPVNSTTLTLRSAMQKAGISWYDDGRGKLSDHEGHDDENEEDQPMHPTIQVFKIDCEGCEYNGIPGLTDIEFDHIEHMVGEVHLGFIPDDRKPSSQRVNATHIRLCQHANFVQKAKECCAYPDLILRTFQPEQDLTVKEFAGKFCDDFDTWASRKRLFENIPDDAGWLNDTKQ